MNYYISDLHLSHTNVIKFDSRPYDTTEEMEADMEEGATNEYYNRF